MSRKKEYVPPAAELMLLSPCEELAVWDWSFENVWKKTPGYHPREEGIASAIVMTGTFYPAGSDGWIGDDGFVIKK